MTKCALCDGTGVVDDTVLAHDPALDWLEAHQEEVARNYAGKHIAINGASGVVAANEDLKALHDEVVRRGLKETCVLHYIPPSLPEKIEEPMIKSLHFPDEKGGLSAHISHSVVPVLAHQFIELFEKGGGINYLELKMSSKARPDFGEIVVTVQKRAGYTPGEKASTYRDIVRNIAVNLNCDKKVHEAGSVCVVCVAADALIKYEGKV